MTRSEQTQNKSNNTHNVPSHKQPEFKYELLLNKLNDFLAKF